MPRYFFHVHDSEEIPDREGTLLADPDEARSQAIVTAGEMLKGLGPRSWGGSEWRMRVTDESGTTICTLRFSAE